MDFMMCKKMHHKIWSRVFKNRIFTFSKTRVEFGKKNNIPIDYNFMKKLSDEGLKSISEYLNKSTKKTIVMTHFPPIQEGTSNKLLYNSQTQDLKNYLAWNNILKDLNITNVPLWISGHTHWSYDIKYNNYTRLISNQLGYKSEYGYTNIIQEGYFEIIF